MRPTTLRTIEHYIYSLIFGKNDRNLDIFKRLLFSVKSQPCIYIGTTNEIPFSTWDALTKGRQETQKNKSEGHILISLNLSLKHSCHVLKKAH